MRYAIVSDIHANWQAWKAVMKDIEREGVDTVLCLGDVVGYGPDPARVLESVYSKAENFVLGNHDAVICNKIDSESFNDEPKRIIEWTRDQLNDSAAKFFGEVPMTLVGENFLLAHAEVAYPGRFDYIYEPQEAIESFDACLEQLIFIGHTHYPCAIRRDPNGAVAYQPPESFSADPDQRYLINVGSVGDPRNGDTRAHYAIFDQDKGHIDFRRVPFDIEGYRQALIKSKLPTKPLLFDFIDAPKEQVVSVEKSRAMNDTPAINLGHVHTSTSSKKRIMIVRKPSATAAQFGSPIAIKARKQQDNIPFLMAGLFLGAIAVGTLVWWLNRGPMETIVPPEQVAIKQPQQWTFDNPAALSKSLANTELIFSPNGVRPVAGNTEGGLGFYKKGFLTAADSNMMAVSTNAPSSFNFWISPEKTTGPLFAKRASKKAAGYALFIDDGQLRFEINGMGGKGFVVRSNKRLSIARGEPLPVASFDDTLAAHVSFDDETKPTYARSEGVIGKAAKLTASQDHSLPLPSIPEAPECTWAIWVNLVRPPPNLGAIIQSDKAAFHVLFGEPFFRVQGAEHPAGANPETGSLPYDFTPHQNRWTHIAVTYSSLTNQTAYFINGVRTGTTSGKITPPVAFENFRLGRFDGMLDDFRIYTSILKPKQVDALYQLGNQSLIPEVSWQHVSLNYNGSGSAEGMKLFLDGKEAPLAILENGLETDCYSSEPFRFGADADGKGFVGRIDDFTYFPRNLEAADLSEMLNPPPAPVPTPQP